MNVQRLLVCAVLLCICEFLHQSDAKNGGKSGWDYYSYTSDDDTPPPPRPPPDTRIQCYSCSYAHGLPYEYGVENCNHTFKKDGIPELMCNGSCSMAIQWFKKPDSYTIHRGCQPNCQPTDTDAITLKCCKTKLCNAFTSSFRPLDFQFHIFVVIGTFVLQEYFRF